jgi:hypothetical protein
MFYLPIKKVEHLFKEEQSLPCCGVCKAKGEIRFEFIGNSNYQGPVLVMDQFEYKDSRAQKINARMITSERTVYEPLNARRKKVIAS